MNRERGPRLAILFPSREIGGAERYVRTIALAASARGWQVCVGFPVTATTDTFRAELERQAIESRDLTIGSAHREGWTWALLAALREAGRTWRLLASFRTTTSLVMLPHPDASIGAVLAAALFPAHATVVVQLVPDPLIVSRSRRLLYTLARRAGQRWVAVSDDNRQKLAAALGCPTRTLLRIHNGVEATRATSIPDRAAAVSAARTATALPAHAEIVLTVARLSHQKGLDVLAAAIARIAPLHPRALWVWVGDGDRREQLCDELKRLGIEDRVLLLGHRGDVDRLLAAADLFVLPSRSEGLPFALLEAMAAGVPVIATDLPVMREVLADGVQGRLVPVQNAEALGEAMSWLLAHPHEAEAMAVAASAQVRERYQEHEMVRRTLSLLNPGPHRSEGEREA